MLSDPLGCSKRSMHGMPVFQLLGTLGLSKADACRCLDNLYTVALCKVEQRAEQCEGMPAGVQKLKRRMLR